MNIVINGSTAKQDDMGGIMKYSNIEVGISERKKVGKIKNACIWIALVLLAVVMAGCVGRNTGQVDGNDGGERMFVEGHLFVTNAEAVNYEPPREYGLQTGKEYYLQYNASKYMEKVDSEMYMNVTLPDSIQKVAGDTEWRGNDETKKIELIIRPIQEGNYEIKAMAKNIGNNFSTVNIIKIHIGTTIEEAKNLTVYTPVVIPLETITGEINTSQISVNSSPVNSGEYIPPKYRGHPNPTNGDQGPINPITGKRIKPGDKFEFNESTLRYDNTLIPLEGPAVDAAPALLGVKALALVPENYSNVRGVAVTYGFKDESNKSYMLRGIQVELWEPHWYGDSKLATVYTVENTSDSEYGLSKSNYVNSSGGWNHVDTSGYFDFGNVYVGDGKDVYLRIVFIGHDGGDGYTSGGTEKLVIHDETVLLGWDIP